MYGRDVEEEICRRIAEGEALTKICGSPGMPSLRQVCFWDHSARPEFAQAYSRAREARAELLIDEMMKIVDSPSADAVQAMDKRLKVDTRKWLIQKLFRRVYGDRVQADIQTLDRNGNPTDPASVNVLVLAADKLSNDELRVLTALYQKMGVTLPHEPTIHTIEHESADD